MGDRGTASQAVDNTQSGVRLIGLLLLAGGVLLLLGWTLAVGDSHAMHSGLLLPTAFIVSGLTLLSGQLRHIALRGVPPPRGGAWLIALMAGSALLLQAFAPDTAPAIAGRASAGSAAVLAAIALVLWCVCTTRCVPVALGQVGAALLLGISTMLLLDASSAAPALHALPMAGLLRPVDAVMLVLLATGALALRADDGLVRLVRHLGRRDNMAWWLVPFALVLPLLLIAVTPNLSLFALTVATDTPLPNPGLAAVVLAIALAGLVLALFVIAHRRMMPPYAMLHRFAAHMDLLPCAVSIRDANGITIMSNSEWRNLERGVDTGKAPGMQLNPPPEQLLYDGPPVRNYERALTVRGERRVYHCSEFMLGSNEAAALMCTVMHEVTAERARAQTRLQRIHDLQLAIRAGDMGVVTLCFMTSDAVADPRALDIFGVSADEFDGRLESLLARVITEDRDALDAALRRAHRRGARLFTEVRVQDADGRIRHVRWRALSRRKADSPEDTMVGVVYDLAEKRAVEHELESMREQLQAILADAPLGAWMRDNRSGYSYHDEHNHRIFGLAIGEMSARIEDTMARVHHEDREEVMHSLQTAAEHSGTSHLQYRALRADGTVRELMSRVTFIEGPHDRSEFAVGVTWDLAHRREAERHLQRLLARLSNDLDRVLILDASLRVISANTGVLEATGWHSDRLRGQPLSELMRTAPADMFQNTLAESARWEGPCHWRDTGGEERGGWARVSGIYDENGLINHYVVTLHEPPGIAAMTQTLAPETDVDGVTGLLNRSGLVLALDSMLPRAPDPEDAAGIGDGMVTAVLAVDIDGFHKVNARHGHAAGDIVLRILARRLRRSVGTDFAVARTCGDAYVVAGRMAHDMQSWRTLADHLLDEMTRPVDLEMGRVSVTASLGIAIAPEHATAAEPLLQAATRACNQSRAEGGNTLTIFREDLSRAPEERAPKSAELDEALARKQFEVEFQPLVDIASRETCGAQALLRWRHPQLGLVRPSRFLALLEESSALQPTGRWVLEQACHAATAWPTCRTHVISVPLSPQQFRDDRLPTTVAYVLEATGLEPSRLRLEVGEGVVMRNPFEARKRLAALRALGIQIAIGDFGAGFSSLGYLRNFPVSCLKIDRECVAGLPTDNGDQAVARSIIGMAHSLGLTVIAEGVESHAQIEFLAAEGCQQAQGHLFSAPVSASELRRLFDVAGRARPVPERGAPAGSRPTI